MYKKRPKRGEAFIAYKYASVNSKIIGLIKVYKCCGEKNDYWDCIVESQDKKLLPGYIKQSQTYN